MKKILCLCLLLSSTLAFGQHKKDDQISLRDHIIEYQATPIAISLSYPQLESNVDELPDNLLTLISNVNRNACTNIAKATLTDEDQTVDLNKLASSPAMLEFYVLSTANESLEEQASYIPQEAWSYGLYSEWQAYANDYIVTISQTTYRFSGGSAHGMTYSTLNNYLKKSGEEFSFGDVIEQKDNFMKLVVKYFCRERKLSVDAPMIKTGLFMELANLPFPKEIGLGIAGLEVIYQPYEIAPYAAGVILVTIPYKTLEDILPEEFFNISSAKGGKTINVKN